LTRNVSEKRRPGRKGGEVVALVRRWIPIKQ
jgi:hypothetical protein